MNWDEENRIMGGLHTTIGIHGTHIGGEQQARAGGSPDLILDQFRGNLRV